MKTHLFLLTAAIAIAASGCFYPPMAEPPPDSKTSVVVPLPYDLAWTAVNDVIRQNSYKIQAQNPNHGIIEVAGRPFTLQDADCGKIKSVAGTYAVQPQSDGTSVYNFKLKAASNESTRIDVAATFDSPLKAPLHPPQDIQCISRGTQESRLLQQILAQARVTHPPEYKKAAPVGQSAEGQSQPELAPGRPTLLKPDVLKKPQILKDTGN